MTPQLATLEVVDALASQAPTRETTANTGSSSTGMQFDARNWLAQHGLSVRRKKPQADRTVFELKVCPFNHEHIRGEAYVLQYHDGRLGAGCHHDSCSWWGWRDLREKFEPEVYAGRSQIAGTTEVPHNPPQDQGWQNPIPLENRSTALPNFPLDAMPDVLAKFAKEVATSRQVPIDLPALLTLGVVAAAGAPRYEVQVGETHAEPLNLFIAVAMPPGSRKSGVFSDVTAPVHEVERELVDASSADIAGARERRELQDARLRELRRKAGRQDDMSARRELEQEATELASSLVEVPDPPTLIVDDATPEKLAMMMGRNGGCIAAMSPEGGIFGMIGGRYNERSGPNLDVYLKAHAGDHLRVDRVNRDSVVIPNPALTIVLAVQPDVIRQLGKQPVFRERGLLARFLYAIPESLP